MAANLLQLVEDDKFIVKITLTVADPLALGLAGLAGSTFITSSYIAEWWGGALSPNLFFPFVALFGGFAQFIAAIFGFLAGEVIITVINAMWASLWIALGILYLLAALAKEAPPSVLLHFPELATWFVVVSFFTWSGTVACAKKDLLTTAVLVCLATGSTIACCMYSYGSGVKTGMKAAAYFWIISAILAWIRVTIILIEDQYTIPLLESFSWLWRRPSKAQKERQEKVATEDGEHTKLQ